MNRLQPQNTAGHRVPVKAPANPYDREEGMGMEKLMGMADRSGNVPFRDSEALGLDGPLLDDLLKGRMTEGMRIGHRRGSEEASQRYAGIFDEGYDGGLRDGQELGARKRSEQLVPTLRGLRRAMAELSRLTRSSVMRERLGFLEDEISYALGEKLRPEK